MNSHHMRAGINMRSLFVAIPVSLMVVAGGCKPKDGGSASETKTLDNFAKKDGDQLVVNKCGIEYTGKESLSTHVDEVKDLVQGETEFKNVALGVMEAVPKSMMSTFFGLKGKILISSKAEKLCRTTNFSQAEKDMAGKDGAVQTCWRQSAPGQPPEIVLPENKEVIRHSLLRLFAYAFTEAFVGTIKDATSGSLATPEAKAAAEGFIAERGKIAKAFLKDLKKMKRPEVYQKLSDFNAKDSEKFGNFVYSEAVDSYYCSVEARASFKKSFRATWKRFTSKKAVNSPVNLFGAR
jgi:hypothetical protein